MSSNIHNNSNNPFPWMMATSHKHQEIFSRKFTANYNNNLTMTTTKSPLEPEEEETIRLEAPKFADMNTIMMSSSSEKKKSSNTTGSNISSNSSSFDHHSEEYRNHHLFTHCKDPRGLSSYGSHIIISNTINRKLIFVIAFVLLVLIIEITVFRGKVHQISTTSSSSSSSNLHRHESSSSVQRPVKVSFGKIDVSTEAMTIFWSSIVMIVLGAMIQTFVIDYDSNTGHVLYSKYRFGFLLVSRREFSVTAVRQVLAKTQSTPSMKKKGGLADTTRQTYSIELHVTSMKSPAGFPAADLQVDLVAGQADADELMKSWVAFFQRIGANCEVGTTFTFKNEGTTTFV